MQKYTRAMRWWFALLILSGVPVTALAQATGTIIGIVTDPSGAVIPNARVTAIRLGTGVSQSTVTGTAGTYTIPNLGVGTYNVTVQSQGFRTGSAADVTLDVSQQREVDFKLTLVGVESTVEVDTAPPLLNTTDATIAGLVSQEQVETLPLNGRDIAGLVTMQPGMAQDTGSMGWMMSGIGPQWIANGNRGETLTGTLDNSDISDAEMGTLQFTNFNLDAIAEFKVLQNNYSAQYGQGGGTITEIVSKTGTNRLHGSAFEFVRNDKFDARNYFALNTPPFKRNEFGGTFGGPIKKDKTFFFGEYAGFRQRLGEPNVVQVPTAAERQGQITINGFDYQVPLNSVAQQIRTGSLELARSTTHSRSRPMTTSFPYVWTTILETTVSLCAPLTPIRMRWKRIPGPRSWGAPNFPPPISATLAITPSATRIFSHPLWLTSLPSP
jgi:hypothetical protein